MWEKIIKDYFSFTKRERVAVIILVILIIVFLVLPDLLPDKTSAVDLATFEEASRLSPKPDAVTKETDNYTTPHDDYTSGYRRSKHPAIDAPGDLFYFDPNTLPEEGWKKLGLPDRTIRTLKNYISKGGRFRIADDMRKIYGLHAEQLHRLLPYVRIAQNINTAHPPVTAFYAAGKYTNKYTPKYTPHVRLSSIDINTADTSAFISLPGIGSKLAARIIHFREKLGGFYAVDQLSEVYGLPDSVFQLVRPRLAITTAAIQTLNLNTVEATQLKEHPYFRWPIANAIIAYRRQHGDFSSVDQLLQLTVITPEQLKKMAPYIMLR